MDAGVGVAGLDTGGSRAGHRGVAGIDTGVREAGLDTGVSRARHRALAGLDTGGEPGWIPG